MTSDPVQVARSAEDQISQKFREASALFIEGMVQYLSQKPSKPIGQMFSNVVDAVAADIVKKAAPKYCTKCKGSGKVFARHTCPQCKGCGMWEYPKPVCSFCGLTHPVQSVEVKTIDAELVQMTSEQLEALERIKRNKKMRQNMARTPEELLRHLIEEGAKYPVAQAEKILGGRKTPAARQELYHLYAKIIREQKA